MFSFFYFFSTELVYELEVVNKLKYHLVITIHRVIDIKLIF